MLNKSGSLGDKEVFNDRASFKSVALVPFIENGASRAQEKEKEALGRKYAPGKMHRCHLSFYCAVSIDCMYLFECLIFFRLSLLFNPPLAMKLMIKKYDMKF